MMTNKNFALLKRYHIECKLNFFLNCGIAFNIPLTLFIIKDFDYKWIQYVINKNSFKLHKIDRIHGEVAWRRGWDSNPRYACTYTRFRIWRIQPDSATSPHAYRRQTILVANLNTVLFQPASLCGRRLKTQPNPVIWGVMHAGCWVLCSPKGLRPWKQPPALCADTQQHRLTSIWQQFELEAVAGEPLA